MNILESCNNAIYNMGINLLITVWKILTECDSLDIMTGMTNNKKLTNLTEFYELTGISGMDRPYNTDWTDRADRYWQNLPNSADSDRV